MSATHPEPGLHAVLGGSLGIGYAYALWHARRGARLVVNALHGESLDAARRQLLAAGAQAVTMFPADLTIPEERHGLLECLQAFTLTSLFMGGPSPPPGSVEALTPAELRAACEICLVYPHEVLSRMAASPRKPQRIILLSSSATTEPLAGHQFFASALLRRTLDQVVCQFTGLRVEVWRPTAVLTALSEAYAQHLPPVAGDDSPVARLRRHFNQEQVPTAEEYVNAMMAAENKGNQETGRLR